MQKVHLLQQQQAQANTYDQETEFKKIEQIEKDTQAVNSRLLKAKQMLKAAEDSYAVVKSRYDRESQKYSKEEEVRRRLVEGVAAIMSQIEADN